MFNSTGVHNNNDEVSGSNRVALGPSGAASTVTGVNKPPSASIVAPTVVYQQGPVSYYDSASYYQHGQGYYDSAKSNQAQSTYYDAMKANSTYYYDASKQQPSVPIYYDMSKIPQQQSSLPGYSDSVKPLQANTVNYYDQAPHSSSQIALTNTNTGYYGGNHKQAGSHSQAAAGGYYNTSHLQNSGFYDSAKQSTAPQPNLGITGYYQPVTATRPQFQGPGTFFEPKKPAGHYPGNTQQIAPEEKYSAVPPSYYCPPQQVTPDVHYPNPTQRPSFSRNYRPTPPVDNNNSFFSSRPRNNTSGAIKSRLIGSQTAPTFADSKATLWMGELEQSIDEGVLEQMWVRLGYTVSIKIKRHPVSGQSLGYGFVSFGSLEMAEKVMNDYNSKLIPDTIYPGTRFKLGWASSSNHTSSTTKEKATGTTEYSIFVGDLDPEISEETLLDFFKQRYPSTDLSRVVIDPITGKSKLYGFVRIKDPNELERAFKEMPGVALGKREMVIRPAEQRARNSYKVSKPYDRSSSLRPTSATTNRLNEAQTQTQTPVHPYISTLVISLPGPDISSETIYSIFEPFGFIAHTEKQPFASSNITKWFVQFRTHEAAAQAKDALDGVDFGGEKLSISWAHHQLISLALFSDGYTRIGGQFSRSSPSQSNAGFNHPSVSEQNRYFLGARTHILNRVLFHPYLRKPISVGSVLT